METVWKNVQSVIKKSVPDHSFRMWIGPLEYQSFQGGRLQLNSPNFFSRKRILDQYAALIEKEFEKIAGEKCKLSVDISAGKKKKPPTILPNRQMTLPSLDFQPRCGRLLSKNYTFDQFVVGKNNDLAYSAALSLASMKHSQQGSLFLLGKTGMGKSHLSQAIGHHLLSEHVTEKVYYITAEDFTNEMVNAFKNNSINQFKTKYRNGCDVLLLEDVHYLSGKKRTQEELSLTLESLHEADKKIIFSSCYLPSDIPGLNDKLRSRFSCSLISNIDPPDFKTRVRILNKKSMRNNITISKDVIDFLAGALTEDVRQLESGLIGITARGSLLGKKININLAEGVVKDIVRIQKRITIDVIKKLVCKEFNVSVNDIVSPSRKQCYTRPRQIAMYLSRKYTDAPLQLIGKSYNRYHATTLHSINCVERGIKDNTIIKKQVEILTGKLDAGKF
ncbi:MAG: chromosomal replication initiator protein DnaA [Deltaproteobacteria bacterium]|nr:chromosomal replication initiator protein DnaA [Deltaproteobacteria bacterium]